MTLFLDLFSRILLVLSVFLGDFKAGQTPSPGIQGHVRETLEKASDPSQGLSRVTRDAGYFMGMSLWGKLT